jgi:hypothetical protein
MTRRVLTAPLGGRRMPFDVGAHLWRDPIVGKQKTEEAPCG